MGGVSYVPLPVEGDPSGSGSGQYLPVLLGGKDAYAVNNIEDADPLLYVGKTKPDASWLVIFYDDTTGVLGYATIANNAAITTYAAAWSGRATLTYTQFDEADL